MRLSASLTARPVSIFAATALAAVMLCGCAGKAPRNPAASDDKNASRTLDEDNCVEAQSRGAPPPVGCPANSQQNRRTVRPLPTLDDPMNLPTLPGGALPGGGVLGR